MAWRSRSGLTSAVATVAVLAGGIAACSPDRPEIVVELPVSSTTVTPSETAAPAPPTAPDGTAPTETLPTETMPTPNHSRSPGGPSLIGHHVPVVIAEHPHDADAFTQGLEWHDGALLESTGLEGRSTLRLVDPETGIPALVVPASAELFAEGVTVVDGEAVQLTYQDEALLRTALPPDPLGPAGSAQAAPPEMAQIDDAYEGEGWGLCFDGEHLVMSNGSDELTFRDPDTFDIERTITVTLDDRTIDYLNELECVGHQILANVWQTDSIVVIDSFTGEVIGSIDASSLVPVEYRGDDSAVLNGIAYNANTDTFWLTGKLWPVMYEVRFAQA